MSKVVEERAKALYEAIKDSQDVEFIKEKCELERQWLEENYKHNTIGKNLSRYYNSLFYPPSITLTDSNSFIDTKRSGGREQRHLFFKHCGFSAEDWQKRANYVPEGKKSLPEKLINASPIHPDLFLQVTGQLLLKNDYQSLAAGLIAATGCRPIEIILLGHFKPTDDDYKMKFWGQAKKRGKKPEFTRPVLFPVELLCKVLKRFRNFNAIKNCANFAEKLLNDGATEEEVNRRINDKIGHMIWEASAEAFDGVIYPVYGEKFINNQSLRAAFGTLVVRRDCEGSNSAKMVYFAKAIGHISKDEDIKKTDLQAISTTIGYGKYHVKEGVKVPFMPIPEKKKESISSVRVYGNDLERMKELQNKWDCPNQQELVRNLLDLAFEQLDTREKQLKPVQTVEKVEEPKDFSGVESEALKDEMKQHPGTAAEKISRAVQAIMDYNDFTAPSNDERWCINIQSIRDLSGSRYKVVSEYVKNHKEMIDTHNGKFSEPLGKFHNQRHGKRGVKIRDVIDW